MTDLDPVCPYCMAETMTRTEHALGGATDQCLDCGYTREREADDGSALRAEHTEEAA